MPRPYLGRLFQRGKLSLAHCLDDFLVADFRERNPVYDCPAVPQNGADIRDGTDFAHPVRDNDKADAVSRQAAHNGEKPFAFPEGQVRSWFVEKDDSGSGGERSCNFDELTFMQVEIAN
jgi:hypothetical protein